MRYYNEHFQIPEEQYRVKELKARIADLEKPASQLSLN